MIKNKQSTRAFTAFLVTWAFVVLTLTGVVLYIVPQGRVAYWIHWSLLGLGKDAWGDIHILFGSVFIVTGALHLYFNWKPFKQYLAARVRDQLEVKRELVTSLALALLLIAGAIANVPPVSWVFELNEYAKESWASEPGHEPPFGHAEEVALPALARRAEFDLPNALSAMRTAGIRIDDPRANLERIARNNDTTPAALYALIPSLSQAVDINGGSIEPLEVEERLAGTGMGGKTLQSFAQSQGLDLDTARQRLAAIGIEADAGDKLKAIAEEADLRPIEVAKVLLITGYRPQVSE